MPQRSEQPDAARPEEDAALGAEVQGGADTPDPEARRFDALPARPRYRPWYQRDESAFRRGWPGR